MNDGFFTPDDDDNIGDNDNEDDNDNDYNNYNNYNVLIDLWLTYAVSAIDSIFTPNNQWCEI